MRIATKFILSSAAIVVMIAGALGSSTVVVKRAEQEFEANQTRLGEALDLSLQLKLSLQNQAVTLRDFLVLGQGPQAMARYGRQRLEFFRLLYQFEQLVPEADTVDLLRRRHHNLQILASRLTTTEVLDAEARGDLKAVESLSEDIGLVIDGLIVQVRQLNRESQLRLQTFYRVARYFQLGLLVILSGMIGLQFRLILLPVVRSIETLQRGADQLGDGQLQTRVQIHSQDEIAALGYTFNAMADRLAASHQNLEEQIKARTTELQAALARLSAIVNTITDGLMVIDPDHTITQTNPALASLFNVQAPPPDGQDWADVIGPTLVALADQANQNPGDVFTAEVELPSERTGKAIATAIASHKTPTEIPLDANAEPEELGVVVTVRDITTDKEVDAMKTDFISTVSHELRTPLTSVLGFAKIIQKKLVDTLLPEIQTDDPKIKRAMHQVSSNLTIILAEGERLTTLINDVLDIAKMEAGQVDWRSEPLQIEAVLERSLIATQALFEDKGLQVVQEVEPNLPTISGDRDRLMQVVINLISNAVKFTDHGTITCSIQMVDQAIQVGVQDQGIGIAAADLPQVFEKFKQVGDTLTDKPKGTGLGLSICQQIVEHHGGQIWVESELGQGAQFFFTLPVPVTTAAAPQPPRVNLDDLLVQLQKHAPKRSAEQAVGAQPVVLIIDDDQSIRTLVRQQLETEGYTVYEAKDGLDGLNLAKQTPPDLIILDVMMPDINGFDVAAVLKNDPQTLAIPIIMNSIIEDTQRGDRVGVDRYLTKPADPQSLVHEVHALLSQGKSTKKVMIVDETASTLKAIAAVLEAKGYTVTEVLDRHDVLATAMTTRPDLIIVSATLPEKQNIIRTLRFEKGLDKVLFLVLADEQQDGSNQA